ncbi:MAG: hypothetical protein GF401_05050 [Chitinivibrionales bacterium]|nr:hypothetical protein [Chitinivibrionales bacterium]
MISRNTHYFDVNFFRKANQSDITAIVSINNSCALPWKQNGFVLNAVDEQQIAALTGQPDKAVYVCGTAGRIEAFVITASDEDRGVLDKVHWYSSDIRSRFFACSRLYISKVAVHPSAQRSGRAHFLYVSLLNMFPTELFYAFITQAPVQNSSSVAFHRSMNFGVFGCYTAEEYCGLQGYRSELYGRFM